MTKILLVCALGMSTSILVKRMDDYCLDNDIDAEILAVPIGQAQVIGNDWDVIMTGPQIAFKFDTLQATLEPPVVKIPKDIYALGKGKETVELAFQTITENKK